MHDLATQGLVQNREETPLSVRKKLVCDPSLLPDRKGTYPGIEMSVEVQYSNWSAIDLIKSSEGW